MAKNKEKTIESQEISPSNELEITTSPVVTSVKKDRKSETDVAKITPVESRNTCTLYSRLQNPVYITYGDSSILLPPRGIQSGLNPEMLGRLPKGVELKRN